MIEAMTRERLWLRIDLHCLSRQATDQLVHAMLPCAHVSDETLAQIYAQSRGNPLFVRELVEGMSAHGRPVAADEGCQDLSRLAARLPARRRVLIGMRLALMDEPLRRVLGLAAAADATEISLSQLREGAAALKPPVDIPVLFDALDRALRLRLLEERGEGYAFRHPIVRAALYDCLPRHRRDELHAALTAHDRRCARSIDGLPGILLSSGFLRPSSSFGGTAGRVLEGPHAQSGGRYKYVGKTNGRGVGDTVPETDYSLGGAALVNVVRGTTSSHMNRGCQSNSPRLRMYFGTRYSCPLERMVNGVQSADFSLQEVAGLDPRRGPGADDVIGRELSMGCACLVMLSSAISLITRLPGASARPVTISGNRSRPCRPLQLRPWAIRGCGKSRVPISSRSLRRPNRSRRSFGSGSTPKSLPR